MELSLNIQINKTIKTIRIKDTDIPVDKLRGDDEKCTELDLSSKGYEDADAIIIAALLTVPFLSLALSFSVSVSVSVSFSLSLSLSLSLFHTHTHT